MKGFARVTKLGNIGGRADYISNPDRQEKIVAKSESVDWQPYQEFERANQRTATKNNEGREVMVMLPNEWAELPEAELFRKAQKIAETVAGKSTDMQWAVHWNKTYTNLHIHVIFSERQREQELKRWDRDIYHTDDGKVARKKSERAKNPDGSIKPPVHRKGELKGGFTAKDTRYTERSWVKSMKDDVIKTFRTLGVDIERNDPLHQYHEGKGADSDKIHGKNVLIKQNNEAIKKLSAELPDFPMERLEELALACVGNGTVLTGDMLTDELELYGYPPNALNHKALPEPSQEAPESILEPSADERVEIHPKAPKSKSETILEAMSGMDKALNGYNENLRNMNQCKFWERSKKSQFSQQAYDCRKDFEKHLATLKSYGLGGNLSFTDVWYKPELLDYWRDKVETDSKPQPEPQPKPLKKSLQMSMEDARQQIQQQKEKSSVPAKDVLAKNERPRNGKERE